MGHPGSTELIYELTADTELTYGEIATAFAAVLRREVA